MQEPNPESKTIATAYGEKASYEYDKRRFSTPHGKLFNQLEMEQLSRVARDLAHPSRILEVGCGTGRFMRSLCSKGHKVYGLEPSVFMLDKAREKTLQFEYAYYVLGEGKALPFPNDAFDLVYSIRVINQVASLDYAFEMIKEMVRVCRSRGCILLEFCNSRGIRRRKYRGVRMSVGDLEALLNCDPSVCIESVTGILFLSQTVMNMVPVYGLSLFERVDRKLAGCLPQLCSRCYAVIRK